MLFAISVFYLSGAINALLIVIAKPHLLLLTRHEVDDQPERQNVIQGCENRGEADGQDVIKLQIIPDAIITEHSPEPSAIELMDGGSSNSTAPSGPSPASRAGPSNVII